MFVQNCGDCCGPVPVSHKELQEIKEAVMLMPRLQVNQLRRQKREPLQCILWDMKEMNCSVYESRPKVCRMFGFYQDMKCPNNTSHANKSKGAGQNELKDVRKNFAGILTTQIKWEVLLNE